MVALTDAPRLRFRLKQHGIPVAWAEGPGALAEISHYALVYSQDAPVQIEWHVKGKWKSWRPSTPTPFAQNIPAEVGEGE